MICWKNIDRPIHRNCCLCDLGWSAPERKNQRIPTAQKEAIQPIEPALTTIPPRPNSRNSIFLLFPGNPIHLPRLFPQPKNLWTLRGNLAWPIHITCTPLECGRKWEHPEKTHADMGRMCKLIDSHRRLELNLGPWNCEAAMLTTEP